MSSIGKLLASVGRCSVRRVVTLNPERDKVLNLATGVQHTQANMANMQAIPRQFHNK